MKTDAKILSFLIAGLFILAPASFVSAPAMTSVYSTDIAVENSLARELVDYQVAIMLDGSNFDFSKASANGSDVLVEDMNGNPLPYWIEEWNSSESRAKIWVKVPRIPANGEVGVKLVYGDPSVESRSNGDEVFEFFDEFIYVDENGIAVYDPDKWSVLYGTWVVEDGKLSPSGYYSSVIDTIYTKTYTMTDGIVEMKFSPLKTRCAYCYNVGTGLIVRYNTTAGDTYLFNAGGYGYAYEIATWPRIPQPYWNVVNKTGSYGVLQHDVDYRFMATLVGDWIEFDILEGSLSGTHLEVNDSTIGAGAIGIMSWQEPRVDWIFVRKYAEVEPVVTVGRTVTQEIRPSRNAYHIYAILTVYWYHKYQQMHRAYPALYNESVNRGVSNETLQESQKHLQLAEGYFKEINQMDIIRGQISMFSTMRKAYTHMRKAIKLLGG
ncbi:hypothetical protein JCM16138_07460 [Thermococcus atlanticus]